MDASAGEAADRMLWVKRDLNVSLESDSSDSADRLTGHSGGRSHFRILSTLKMMVGPDQEDNS